MRWPASSAVPARGPRRTCPRPLCPSPHSSSWSMTSSSALWRCRPQLPPASATTCITAFRLGRCCWMIPVRRREPHRRRCFTDIEARIGRCSMRALLDAEQRADIDMIARRSGVAPLELDEDPELLATIPPHMWNCWATGCIRPMCCTTRRRRSVTATSSPAWTKIPELIRQAEANLQDSAEVWNRVAWRARRTRATSA